MEAKDTVTQSHWPLTYEEYLKDRQAQAEISFKAGIREVLDWEEEHNVIGYVYDTDDPEVEKQNMIDHANQLKEWGL